MKKEKSQRQKEHLQRMNKARMEKQKKDKEYLKKLKQIRDLNIDLDEIIEKGKKNKIKAEYENIYGTQDIKNTMETEFYKKPEPQNIQTNYSYYISDNPWA